jgi:hypothetical protein
VGSTERIRIELAFDGGQIIGALVEPASADALELALDSGSDDAVRVESQDGTYRVVPKRVVYYKRFRPGGRVGFGDA